jgi:hypothetical protein
MIGCYTDEKDDMFLPTQSHVTVLIDYVCVYIYIYFIIEIY